MNWNSLSFLPEHIQLYIGAKHFNAFLNIQTVHTLSDWSPTDNLNINKFGIINVGAAV